MKPSIAVLYLCTGAYRVFWHDFYPNFKAHFLPDCERTFFVFTDAAAIDYESEPDVRRIYQAALPWPQSTMQRFDAFLGQADTLRGYDYLFFANANLRCLRDIAAEELLPDTARGQSLTVVCHLPYYGKNPIFSPYDRNPKCSAYVPYNCGEYYVAGGLNGGCAEEFLALCKELKARTDADTRRGVVARCHDESQLNCLVAQSPARFRVVGPDYCTPEETPTATEAIRVVQKKHYINVDAVKGPSSRKIPFLRRKWEAFCENYMPYAYQLRDTLLQKRI